MYDLMGENSRQFGLTIKLCQQPPVDADLTSRKSPGVGGTVVDYEKLVRQFTVADSRKLVADLADIILHPRIGDIVATLALTQG